MPEKGGESNRGRGNVYKDKEKPTSIRESNITAAKAVADAVRTSLGPKGMDKMVNLYSIVWSDRLYLKAVNYTCSSTKLKSFVWFL
ncbi:T-complex protein 1 subunit delta [Holothuria leucospilota]|uniref:T-complex protein 1 subunit delta n=1 Tax=Holothuria leucospilota TaxID=206669 RepID=A0A9Q1B980_HOLLE|nr:T-complex protein 1 subunit delta [Holothuria leucospilota]